ncbi:MAG: DUF5103 domain-containing protein [Bacteroidales bacterium]|jgi:hypothetical protein|nr:DUF5103 domain-containing protein [Bacteroidales bacterium]
MRKFFLFFLALILSCAFVSNAQQYDIQLDNVIYVDGIASVQLISGDDQLSEPVAVLGDKFHISFDDLNLEIRHLKYTFIHCTHDWQPSQLNPIEYIDGFMEEDITQYDHSFNTIEPYMHYQADFPNENISITKSGNYVLFVYDDSPDNPILTRRFMVLEPVPAKISCDVHAAVDVNNRFSHQDVDFTVFTGGYNIRNPQQTVRATIQQNGRWDNAKFGLVYRSGVGQELHFDYIDGRNSFPGSSEFRTFDISTLRSNADRVVGISFVNHHTHVYVLQDDARPYVAYESRGHIHGRCYYRNRDLNNDYSEDYVFTHFTLKSSFPFTDGDVYVFGELTDWQLLDDAKLHYNKEFDFWETELLLKQGVYNYQYVYVPRGTNDLIDATYVEGSHYQTNNIYYIYVYYQEEGSSYDRLIGFQPCSILDK